MDQCTLENLKCAAEQRAREQRVAAGRRQRVAAEHRESAEGPRPETERRPSEEGLLAESRRPQAAEQPKTIESGPDNPGQRTGLSVSSGAVEILRDRDFRLLWSGQFVSLLGDQFFVVALPWLVLQLAGNALAIGSVLAVSAAPRTIFLLIGGALIDRFSPRAVMLYSNLGRMALVAVLALLTAAGSVQLWMLYPIAFLLGLGYAFYLPAQSAIIPRMVPDERLQVGNAVIQGTSQLSLFLGPVVAGVLIALLGGNGTEEAAIPESLGLAIVFALDAAGFLFSSITLAMITHPAVRRGASAATGIGGVFRSLGEGLADVWRDRSLRLYFVLIGVVNLALLGPLAVGIPVLAATRFRGGAFAFGAILSGLGAGAVAGVVLAGVLRRPQGRAFTAAMLGCTAALGLGLALLGAVPTAGLAVAAAFLVGVAEGYLIVEFITWLQLRTSKEELGRMMSILLFVSVGMAPLSNLIAGALLQVSASLVMIAAGGLILLVGLIAALSPSVWRLDEVGRRPGREGFS
jgi:MFS family permease